MSLCELSRGSYIPPIWFSKQFQTNSENYFSVWPWFDGICIPSVPVLLCNQESETTLEWHGWIEARHCQLIINTLSANFLHSTALPSCVCACECGGAVIVCGKETVGRLQVERCLHAQSPCQGITAAWGKLHRATVKEVKGVLVSRHEPFQSGTFYPLLLAVCPWEITCCFITGTNKHM